ncbi:hypothetical protein DL96DRAFT_693213 [Flagelloscypha sp. PMI_526]|nr:hypothetical protein DL96DRAFT_693213 [Flagelloscypha sp. PMI_526]
MSLRSTPSFNFLSDSLSGQVIPYFLSFFRHFLSSHTQLINMKFSAVFTLLAAAAAVSAAPLAQRACNLGKCAAALAPTVVGCGAAAAELGANLLADAACLAAAVNDGVNLPSVCSGCQSKVKELLEDGAEAVGDAVSGAADFVGDQF